MAELQGEMRNAQCRPATVRMVNEQRQHGADHGQEMREMVQRLLVAVEALQGRYDPLHNSINLRELVWDARALVARIEVDA